MEDKYMSNAVSATIISRDYLPVDGDTNEFEGQKFRDVSVSFIWVDMRPGRYVRLHKHPYQEVFIILQGQATYTTCQETVEAHAGGVIIVPAEMPHKFTNTGLGQLKQIDIHTSKRIITEWLE